MSCVWCAAGRGTLFPAVFRSRWHQQLRGIRRRTDPRRVVIEMFKRVREFLMTSLICCGLTECDHVTIAWAAIVERAKSHERICWKSVCARVVECKYCADSSPHTTGRAVDACQVRRRCRDLQRMLCVAEVQTVLARTRPSRRDHRNHKLHSSPWLWILESSNRSNGSKWFPRNYWQATTDVL